MKNKSKRVLSVFIIHAYDINPNYMSKKFIFKDLDKKNNFFFKCSRKEVKYLLKPLCDFNTSRSIVITSLKPCHTIAKIILRKTEHL